MKTNVKKIHYLCNIKNINMEDINRIKVVLVEKKRTSKWLSEQMGVAPSTVSKWCTNSSQPDLGNLLKIADLLEVDIKELLVREYKQFLLSQES
jgi:DNA-binding Xre family transcriptional regulator